MDTNKAVEHLHAAVLYFWNTSPDCLTKLLFGDVEESYRAEWCFRYSQGFIEFMSHLDFDHREKFMFLAMAAYGDEAREYVESNQKVECIRCGEMFHPDEVIHEHCPTCLDDCGG